MIAALTGYTLGTNLFVSTYEANGTVDVTSHNTSLITAYAPYVLDFYATSWSGSGTALNPLWDSGDGLHPNKAYSRQQAD